MYKPIDLSLHSWVCHHGGHYGDIIRIPVIQIRLRLPAIFVIGIPILERDTLQNSGAVQERRNSCVLALKLHLYCINPSKRPISSALAMVLRLSCINPWILKLGDSNLFRFQCIEIQSAKRFNDILMTILNESSGRKRKFQILISKFFISTYQWITFQQILVQ